MKKLLDLSTQDLKFVLLSTFPYSRYNDQAIDRATDESWFCSCHGQEMFLFQTSRTALRPALHTPPPPSPLLSSLYKYLKDHHDNLVVCTTTISVPAIKCDSDVSFLLCLFVRRM
jgi:Rieske Fe-S protein